MNKDSRSLSSITTWYHVEMDSSKKDQRVKSRQGSEYENGRSR
ncbi:hypothetical protein Hdeb2414_s0005g00158961 [Helianthus debilis subsp. tardiflorus]